MIYACNTERHKAMRAWLDAEKRHYYQRRGTNLSRIGGTWNYNGKPLLDGKTIVRACAAALNVDFSTAKTLYCTYWQTID